MSKKMFQLIVLFVFVFFGKTELSAQDYSIKTSTKLIQPPYLKAGDTVAIVAPSGILKNRKGEIQAAINLLESWGLHTVVGKHVFSGDHHFAGTDTERCEDMQLAMDDPKISAIWCARGGYGAVRILDRLNYDGLKKDPKWLIGYSDITALHSAFHNQGFETIHAIMGVSVTKDLALDSQAVITFRKALFGNGLNYNLPASTYNQVGDVTAPLVGGNLTMLHTMLGSDTSIDTNGKILFIEEIGEYKYHVDRMLQSLKRAGYFEHCAGVLIGDMTKMKKNTTAWGTSIEQLILDVLADYNVPVAFGMPAGHEKDNRAMILGRTIEMKVSKEGSTVIFKE
ncbi:S66 peptidase family protein [Lacinutrix undariae]